MPADDTRTRLLRIAASHFARAGFEGASMRRIADDAGIKAASIFHHVPGGKRALYDAIFEDLAETIRVHIVGRYGADAGLRPEDAVVQMAAAFWDYFAEHGDYAKLILLQSSGTDRSLANVMEGAADVIVGAARAFMRDAQARGELGEFDVEHFMLWSSLHTLTVHGARYFTAYLVPDEDRLRLRESYLAMVRGFVRPARGRKRTT